MQQIGPTCTQSNCQTAWTAQTDDTVVVESVAVAVASGSIRSRHVLSRRRGN